MRCEQYAGAIPLTQIFPRYADTLFRAILAGLLLCLLGGLILMVVLPFTSHATREGLVVEQPVQFSHAHHVKDLGLDCRMCHTSV